MKSKPTRRELLVTSFAVIGSAAILQPSRGAEKKDTDDNKEEREKDQVSPPEDLMREHGVLKRLMLVYGEAIVRIDGGRDLSPDPILEAARLIRSFVEDYHEKLEEHHLFPRFRKAQVHVDLVDVLTAQHAAGRKLTDEVFKMANLKALKEKDSSARLRQAMSQFIRMYSPHEAREDTVLFPALRKVVPPHEYDSLGEEFEKKEHALFGDDGFEKIVSQVAEIEKRFGIYELSQFTP